MNYDINKLYSKLKDTKPKSPLLLVGSVSNMFKQHFSGEIFILNNDNLEELYTHNLKNSVIDITNVTDYLKFVKLLKIKSKDRPYILLSTNDTDKISKELLTICNLVIKAPYIKDSCAMISAEEAVNIWKEREVKGSLDTFYAEESPELYYLRYKTNRIANSAKIVDLISNACK